MSLVIAVTGATGFIGKALCAQLVTQANTVRALVRDPQKAVGIPGVEIYRGDITQPNTLSEFVEGVDAVVHCAGSVRGATQDDFDRINVSGLGNLLAALQSLPTPPRLLNLSSLAAREPELSYYAGSKFRGEQLLRSEAGSLPWAAFRPPPVYGPGDKELMPLLKLMAKGFAVIPGKPDARFSMIYIDDLVDAIHCWLNQKTAVTGVFELEDGHRGGYDWHTMIATVSELSGRRVRRIPVPAGLLNGIARLNRAAARRIGYAPMLTPEKLRELRHSDWTCDSQPLQYAMPWKPRVQLREGLQNTIFKR